MNEIFKYFKIIRMQFDVFKIIIEEIFTLAKYFALSCCTEPLFLKDLAEILKFLKEIKFPFIEIIINFLIESEVIRNGNSFYVFFNAIKDYS